MADKDSMMEPPIEELLQRTGSKFALVTLASRRAREIHAYFNQLGDGLGGMVPPQVPSKSHKPLTISFEEIAGGKIKSVPLPPPEIVDVAVEVIVAPVVPEPIITVKAVAVKKAKPKKPKAKKPAKSKTETKNGRN